MAPERGEALEPPKPLVIRTAGTLRVEDSQGNDLTPAGRRAKGLLAMLAMTANGIRSRRWLQDKLWSDRPYDQGAANLRQELSNLRKHFREKEFEVLSTDRDNVRLNLSIVWVDRGGGLGPVGELFEGLDVRDPEFESWIRLERSRAEEDTSCKEADDNQRKWQRSGTGHGSSTPFLAARFVATPHILLRNMTKHAEATLPTSETMFSAQLGTELLTSLGALSGAFLTRTKLSNDGDAPWYELEVPVRATAAGMQVTAQLFVLESGECLWTARYQVPSDEDPHSAQQKISREIVEAVQRLLREGGAIRIWAEVATVTHAWEQFQRGRVQEAIGRPDAMRRARKHYKQALIADPSFTPAMISMAFCLLDEFRLGWATNPDEVKREARSIQLEVAARCPSDPYARALEAFVHCVHGRHAQSCDIMEGVVRDVPDSPELLAYLGVLAGYAGVHSKEVSIYDHALDLVPYPPLWIQVNRALACAISADARAGQLLSDVLLIDPKSLRAHLGKVLVASHEQQSADAKDWASRLRTLQPAFDADNWCAPVCYKDKTFHRKIALILRSAGL